MTTATDNQAILDQGGKVVELDLVRRITDDVSGRRCVSLFAPSLERAAQSTWSSSAAGDCTA